MSSFLFWPYFLPIFKFPQRWLTDVLSVSYFLHLSAAPLSFTPAPWWLIPGAALLAPFLEEATVVIFCPACSSTGCIYLSEIVFLFTSSHVMPQWDHFMIFFKQPQIFHFSEFHLSARLYDKEQICFQFFLMIVIFGNIVLLFKCFSETGSLTDVNENFCVRCVKC